MVVKNNLKIYIIHETVR